MDDLRWILLLVGVVIIAAVFFSSRFEGESWKRERSTRKATLPQPRRKEPSVAAVLPELAETPAPQEKQEPSLEPVADTSAAEPEITVEEAVDEDSSGLATAELPEAEEPPSDEGEEAESSEDDLQLSIDMGPPSEELAFSIEEDVTLEQFKELGMEPLVLVLSILAKEKEWFTGERIKQVLEGEDFHHGEMNIFHYQRGAHAEPVFSIANIVEPGTFALDKLAELQTPGLTLFCQLPGPMANSEAFDLMLGKAEMIAHQLGGRVCDDKRNLLTPQAIAHYRERINVFGVDVTLALKKASVRKGR